MVADLSQLILRKLETTCGDRLIDFDDDSLGDEFYIKFTGLNVNDFNTLLRAMKRKLRDRDGVHNSSPRNSLGYYLMYLKTGFTTAELMFLFGLIANDNSAARWFRQRLCRTRKVLLKSFVPAYIGFNHISRESIVKDHYHFCKDLFWRE